MSSDNDPIYIIIDSAKIFCPKPERIRTIKNEKDYFYSYPNKKLNYLDLISLEEIDKDFMEFKSKKEEINSQKELINLIKKSKKNKKNKKGIKYPRPETQTNFNELN